MSQPREIVVAMRLQSQMQAARRDLETIADRLDKVGIAGRSAGEQTGLDRIGKEAANASRLVETARDRVDRLAKGIEAAASAGSGPSPFIAALREQIALYGKGTEDVLRYRAAQAGVGAEAAPLILQLQNMRAAQEAAARAAQEEANAQRQAAAARQAATAQADAFIATLREQVALQGKSSADVLRYRAGTLGVGSQAEQYIAAIERFEAVGDRGGKTLNRFGVTAGQTAAAMRMLPAQITDITTSIASGMPVWMVAIQQGGQIKDSFGGWRAAGDALLKVLTPLRLVMGGTAIAAGVLIAAVNAGQQDVAAFNMAVQTTGNYAGATRGQIEQLAESAAAAGGITRGAAREAATAMVQGGRLGLQTIGNLTRVVQDYAAVTGQSTAAASKSLADLFVKPTEGAEKLNEQFHFLSAEQVRYIRQLEEQGRLEEARLVLSERFAQHLGGTFVNNLGYLERAWLSVGNAVKGAWEWLKKWGTADTIDAQVESARKVVETLRAAAERERSQPGFGGFSRNAQALAAAEERLASLEETKRLERRSAAAKAEQAQVEERRVELDKKLKALADTLKVGREKIEDEKKLLDEGLKLGLIKQAEYDKLLAASREKYRDKKVDQVANAFEQQRLTLTQQLAVAEQQLANSVFGVGSSQETATAKLEAWLETSGKAEKLDATRVAALRKLATELDRVSAEQDRVTEATKRRDRIDAGLASVDAQLAQATGRSADAAVAEIQARFRDLRKDLVTAGNTEGLIKLDKLIDMSKARAQLEDLRRQVDLIFGEQSRQQQTLQTEVQLGLVGELDGRQRLLDLQRNTAQAVEVLLPRMRELAALTGDPQMAAGVADLEARVGQLKLRADELQVAFTSTFGDAVKTGLSDLARGTKDLGEAALDFLLNIAQGMAEFAAQQLAMQATTAVVNAFGGGGDGAGTAASAAALAAAGGTVTAGGAAIAGGAAALTAAGTTTTAGAAQVTVAATTLAGAGATLLTGAAAISASAAQLAAAAQIAAVTSAIGFATGGYTGPGGTYQPAGIVHAGEVVVRQSVVRQPGMLPLLLDINRRGPEALRDWPGFAEGGLVTPAAGVPRGALAPPSTRATNNQMAVYNYWDMDELVQRLAQHGGFEKAVVNQVSRNGNTIQRSWKS